MTTDFIGKFFRRGTRVLLVAFYPPDDPRKDGGKCHYWKWDDPSQSVNWVTKMNLDGRGLYYHINPLKGEYTAEKKASKPDIALGTHIHGDLDPPKDCKDLHAWRKAAMTQMGKLPKATWYIDSGRGFWVLWQLDTSCGDKDAVELRNKGIAQLVGADHCWNIDRVARLPGTINHKTGELATVLQHNPEQRSKFASEVEGQARRHPR
jgi:hypothetical protein